MATAASVAKPIQVKETLVRVPVLVVWGNSYVRGESLELLAGAFLRPATETN